MPGDLYSRLAEHATHDPCRTALTFAPLHLDGQRVTVTYGESSRVPGRWRRSSPVG